NKKLNQWKSTRATAEVLYSLVWYLKKEGAMSAAETVEVRAGKESAAFDFAPDRYTGRRNQLVVPGENIDSKLDSQISVSKSEKGSASASATWNFSTEKVPAESRGDLLAVSRSYFRRVPSGSGFVLEPLAEGAALSVGDEVEVHLSLRAGHEAEYVHLRD